MQKPAIGFFALALAAAGLPLYIHLPRYAELELGLSLSTVGTILIGIRILDFAQDPLLGWLVDRNAQRKVLLAWIAAITLAAGFVLLFSIKPQFAPWLWITLVLICVFSAYSLAMILFYGQTRALAESAAPSALLDIAKWREIGSLIGILIAAALPTMLGYTAFGWVLCIVVLAAAWISRPLWRRPAAPETRLTLRDLLASGGGALLLLTLINSLPVAMTSTLFVFFVEDGLGLANLSGFYLILFFLAAAVSIPLWRNLAERTGERLTLVIAMTLAILSFLWAALLPPGATLAFAVICIVSGFATGADMLLLPTLFSGALARAGLQTGQAFGLWSFANKIALAVAAGIVLPLLDRQGFQSAAENSPEALSLLTLLYAIIPCGLKALAILLTLSLPRKAIPA